MKTLKQFYDSLSEGAQAWMRNNCTAWFDINQADYYAKPDLATTDLKELKNILTEELGDARYSAYGTSKKIATRDADLLVYLSNKHPDIVSKSDADKAINQLFEGNQITDKTWLLLSEEQRKEAFIKSFKRYGKMKLYQYLYLIKDFEDFTIDWEECDSVSLTAEVVEIIGKKNAYAMIDRYGSDMSSMIKFGKENDFFDELFFCNTETFNQQQKIRLLENVYADSYHLPTLESTADFFKRIVAVDHSYLRFIYRIVDRYPAIATKLYNEKKPDNEPGENHRYNKELRKLFMIAHACSLGRISKNKCSIVKEIAPLLKIYSYNFKDIYEAMYPEDESIYANHVN